MVIDCGISFDWDMCYVGFSRGFVSPDEVIQWAASWWAEKEARGSPALTRLVICDASDKKTVESCLREFMGTLDGTPAPGSARMQAAVRKWRYIFLCNCQQRSSAQQDLFECVEQVYADFDYPQDMSSLVLYMGPSDGFDPRAHTAEECRQRLALLITEFIQREREALSAGTPEAESDIGRARVPGLRSDSEHERPTG